MERLNKVAQHLRSRDDFTARFSMLVNFEQFAEIAGRIGIFAQPKLLPRAGKSVRELRKPRLIRATNSFVLIL
jgi:hypothetical protein